MSQNMRHGLAPHKFDMLVSNYGFDPQRHISKRSAAELFGMSLGAFTNHLNRKDHTSFKPPYLGDNHNGLFFLRSDIDKMIETSDFWQKMKNPSSKVRRSFMRRSKGVRKGVQESRIAAKVAKKLGVQKDKVMPHIKKPTKKPQQPRRQVVESMQHMAIPTAVSIPAAPDTPFTKMEKVESDTLVVMNRVETYRTLIINGVSPEEAVMMIKAGLFDF